MGAFTFSVPVFQRRRPFFTSCARDTPRVTTTTDCIEALAHTARAEHLRCTGVGYLGFGFDLSLGMLEASKGWRTPPSAGATGSVGQVLGIGMHEDTGTDAQFAGPMALAASTLALPHHHQQIQDTTTYSLHSKASSMHCVMTPF